MPGASFRSTKAPLRSTLPFTRTATVAPCRIRPLARDRCLGASGEGAWIEKALDGVAIVSLLGAAVVLVVVFFL